MENNRDEAIRAKDIAEKKLLERDIKGAKKFALKAQSMYSELDGLSQFLEVIDFYVAFEEKVKGEMDCYRILGVDPSSSEEVLKRQYRKVAFAIHPDKNKSVGAEGAFKILSQVWDVLSNKEKKLAYDLKMNLRAQNQLGNGLHNFSISSYSSSARCTVLDTNQGHISTQLKPQTTSQHFSTILQNPRSQAPDIGSQCHPTPSHSSHPIPCTGACIPRHQNAPLNADWSRFYAAPPEPHDPTLGTSSHHTHTRPCLLNPNPSTHYQYASSSNPHPSQNYQNSPVTTVSSPYYPTPERIYRNYTSARNAMSGSSHHSLKPETFWTACNMCRSQYEYQKIFLNQKLLCPRCQQPFLAREMPTPSVKGRSSCPWLFSHQQRGNLVALNGSIDIPAVKRDNLNNIRIQPSGPALNRGPEKEVNSSTGDKTLHRNVIDRENVEASRDSKASSSGQSGEKLNNRRHTDGLNCNGPRQVNNGSKSRLKRNSENLKGSFGAGQAFSPGCNKPRKVKELSQMEIRDMLMAKAKSEILCKLKEWKIAESKSSPVKKPKIENSMSILQEDLISEEKADQSRDHLLMNNKCISQAQGSPALNDNDDVRANSVQTVSMTVPDADFYNFDQCRTEESFRGNQVWAAYDDDDGMPRYYAVVHQVISVKPFKLQISWLNSKTTSEFGSLDWIGSGFTKTNGDFRIGKYEFSTSLTSFSHPVKWRKGARGAIQVFPTKEDVWAMYTNWSPDWDVLTADETVHKYDMMMILEDYNEHRGVVVAPLVKVAGFTSLFRQHLDQTKILTIPREEIFRFSHQVPHYTLNGKESENSPSGCYELDPAALPLELLKVITEAEEAEAEKIAQRPVKLTESAVVRGSVEKDKPIITYSRKNKMKKVTEEAE
ncbi:uncharacterized protein [Henckelia pumila]|uniref:uncharacterized protein n=1 Tax=Henckelia pumila TaxID=405737 RepID=UPI003C6E0571